MSSPGPLTGIRVVEFGNLIAGPYATMMLADLGAEVVKVEPPSGDLGRHFGPFVDGESAFFLSVNRGKKSIALDLRDTDDLAVAHHLVSKADVLAHNLRRGALERRGLGFDEASERNPGLVYARVSAFGASGPDADRVGIDVIFQAESGMTSITGEAGSPPGKTATTIGDYVAGTNTALAICAALVERSVTGVGRLVDVSLRDGLLAVQGGWNALAFASDEQPPKMGTASPFLAPNQLFATADGHLAVAIVSDRHFDILCRSIGRLDLVERYPTNADRMHGRIALAATLADVFAAASTEHWLTVLTEAGIPVGRVRSLPEVWDDPQVRHHEMVRTLPHPGGGTFRTIGSPLRFEDEQAVTDRRPPRLDEHGDEIRAGIASE